MAMTPSVGDILMLSQTAWKIGRAFTKGTKSAPAEFAEIESEANGLSEALKLVAETLYSDDSLLDKADHNTQSAVATILDSAKRTLSDLESFVDRYRIIRREQTSSGFTTERRTWSEVILANYKTVTWTTEGGNITALRDMLSMHTSTIDLTLQALQSQSLARLEKVVMPMAENVARIHDRVNGVLGDKIDDLHRVIMTVVNGTPSLNGRQVGETLNRTPSNATVSTIDFGNARLLEAGNYGGDSFILGRPLNLQISQDTSYSGRNTTLPNQHREQSYSRESGTRHFEQVTRNNGIDLDFECGAPPISRLSIGDRFDGSTITTAAASPESFWSQPERPSHRMSDAARRESTTLPHFFREHTQAGGSKESDVRLTPPTSPAGKHRVDSKADHQELPPPALSPRDFRNGDRQPATPNSILSSGSFERRQSTRTFKSSRIPTDARSIAQASKHSSLASSANINLAKPQNAMTSGSSAFEKALFRNAAILCDVRCTLVEYAYQNPGEPDPRFDTEMVPACNEARVYVVRKRENRENGGTRVVASIWALSDDGEMRCQQKLPEYVDTVPYCSFFEPEKVAIPPADGEITLRFHAEEWGDRELKDVKTNWVNYKFETEKHANEFQSAIFGRQLLGSFRTVKTCVLHEGFKGAFAFEEQFANIEVLRLWEDDGVNTPGASGGVMALLHMSGNFGQGWAKWWMNNSRQPVRVKRENGKFAKLKGIDIRVLRPPEQIREAANGVRSPTLPGDQTQRSASDAKGKKGPERNVTGVRIEFKTEDEQARFVALVKTVQERVIPLPGI